jgi:hypothetical protein
MMSLISFIGVSRLLMKYNIEFSNRRKARDISINSAPEEN